MTSAFELLREGLTHHSHGVGQALNEVLSHGVLPSERRSWFT
jgi:hypothetical protein